MSHSSLTSSLRFAAIASFAAALCCAKLAPAQDGALPVAYAPPAPSGVAPAAPAFASERAIDSAAAASGLARSPDAEAAPSDSHPFTSDSACDPFGEDGHSRRRWFDSVVWTADLVIPNSGRENQIFHNGGAAEAAVMIPWRLPAPDLLNNDESAEFNWKVGFGGRSMPGDSNVQLVQPAVGSFQVVDATFYWLTLGGGYEAHRKLCEGFTATGRFGMDLHLGGVASKINPVAANPALIQIGVAQPLANDFVWGGACELRWGLIGPRGWGVSSGMRYGGERTMAFTGEDHGSTSFGVDLTFERRLGPW